MVKKRKFFLKNINININDFDTKPKVGGTPAKENKTNIKVVVKKGKLPRLLKSLRVLKEFILNTNNVVKKQKFK